MPPQQTHSYEHIQQSSQQQQTARAWTGNMRPTPHFSLNNRLRSNTWTAKIWPHNAASANAQLWARTAGQSAAATSKSLDE
jgi:hypothetical protein